MAKRVIPAEVQRKVEEIVQRFNQEVIGGSSGHYVPRFKGSFLYLDRESNGAPSPICRLKYTGA